LRYAVEPPGQRSIGIHSSLSEDFGYCAQLPLVMHEVSVGGRMMDTAAQDMIVSAEERGVATITPNRSGKRNAVSLAMWRQLGAMNSADHRGVAPTFIEKPTFTGR
jgi:hypothetical protein